MERIIKTPQTDPDHWVIGRLFNAWDGNVYYCDSWESNAGFWMTQVGKPSIRRCINERAVGGTFHEIYHWQVSMIPLSS